MATMATTSHGLSVYVNSCVKNPLDRRTRASVTFTERKKHQQQFAATDPGPCVRSSNEFSDEERADFGNSLSYKDVVETDLKNLTDEQFYLKLQQLKEANRKTLEECEKLYKAKYGAEQDEAVGNLAAKEIVENMFAARLAARSGHVDGSSTSLEYNGDLTSSDPRDRVRDFSSKPPRAPNSQRENGLSRTTPTRSSAVPNYSSSSRPRPDSAPVRSGQPRRSYSLDDRDWHRAMQDSGDISDDEVRSEGPLDPEFLTAVTKIRDMWRGFKIDDYKTGERRHSSASIARKKKQEQQDIADNWRHRITIPKPFHMSMRDEAKPKKKTKAQMELERQRLEKERMEEEECQKKFKAQPAPAHIYLPLYDEIQEKNEARRRYAKQYCKEMIKSQEKPFNFLKREEEKQQQRAKSATIAERIARTVEKAKKKEPKFVARPVPDFVLDSGPRDRLNEEEEYRKIRIKMRARELLKEASLPPNMAANEKLKEQREKEKLVASKQKKQSKHRQRSSHKIPDYDFLYGEFQKELARRKHARESTVFEPFSLETEHLRSNRERVLRDMERDDKLMRDTARGTPRVNLGVLSSSLDSIPCKSTTSADLRTGYLRSLQEREIRKQEKREDEEHRKRLRDSKLRKYILDRSTDTPRRGDDIKDRLKRHREAEIARLEQYEKDLEEMKERVEKRPLLFERESQLNAGKAADKKFKTTLKSAGISEDFLKTQSSLARTTGSDAEYEEDYKEDFE